MSKAQTQVSAPAVTKIEKRQTNLRHVFLIDWDDAGIFKEVAVVKEDEGDGTIYGILVDTLHPIDQSRLKKIVTSQHADKYPLWELMSQMTLKNGYNALDFFHANYVKVKRPRGAVVGGSDVLIMAQQFTATVVFIHISVASRPVEGIYAVLTCTLGSQQLSLLHTFLGCLLGFLLRVEVEVIILCHHCQWQGSHKD
jgi:hypothetical protein